MQLSAVLLVASTAFAQPAAAPPSQDSVTLQLRVFHASEDVTKETKLAVYPRGQRTGQIAMTLSPAQAYEATVPTGFYDIQVVRERRGQVVGIRWVEQLLVQRYPDEYGRNLHVLNFDANYGALQIRPAPDEAVTAKGWTAGAYPAGDATREVAKGHAAGEDLVIAVPAGRYDVRINLPGREASWLRDIDVPVDRTRLKTWSAAPPRNR